MVCRENKGRSAQMAVVKAMQRYYGENAFHDAEVQSMIHEIKHTGDALDAEAPVSVDEQLQMVRTLRESLRNAEFLSDAQKYAKSSGKRGSRDGIITRLDLEEKRLLSGKNEKGEPLTNAQMNTAANIYAMQRLGNLLENVSPAKENFLEVNARHRGISVDEARKEWDEIVSQDGRRDHHSQIRDTERNALATAGIDPATQHNLGVSGRSVQAMQIMEQRRQSAIAQLDSKAAIDSSHVLRTFEHPGKGVVKCAKCGQFGHTEDECPNAAMLAQREKLSEIYHRSFEMMEIHERLGNYANKPADKTLDEWLHTAYPEDFQDGKSVEEWKQQLDSRVADFEASGGFLPKMKAAKQLAKADHSLEELNRKIDANNKPVSSFAKSLSYNQDSGVVLIERHPDAEGNERPPLILRAQPHEVTELLAEAQSRPVGEVFTEFADNEAHQFANAEDANAALTLFRCPTCGQWASFNTSHQCPVPGGHSEKLDAMNRAARIAYNRNRREELRKGQFEFNEVGPQTIAFGAIKASMKPGTLKGRDTDGVIQDLSLASGHMPKAALVEKELFNNKIVQAPIAMNFVDGKVTGMATVWEELDTDGEYRRVLTDKAIGNNPGLRCDCDEYKKHGTCRHTSAAMNRLAQAWRPDKTASDAQKWAEKNKRSTIVTSKYVPGDTIGNTAAQDARQYAPTPGLGTVRDLKRQRIEADMQRFIANRAAGQGTTTLMTQGPTDREGNPVDWPTTWTPTTHDDEGHPRKQSALDNVTDLTNDAAVAARMKDLFSTTRRTDPTTGKSFSIRARVASTISPGGISVRLPKKLDEASPQQKKIAVEVLADKLGLNPTAYGPKGFFIASNTATYAEKLDLIADTRNPRIRGPKLTYLPSKEQSDAAKENALGNYAHTDTPHV